MFSKILLQQLVVALLLLSRLIFSQPLSPTEEEVHLNNRLRHYLKRIELVAQKTTNQFSTDLQSLIDKFRLSLKTDSFKEKSLLLEKYTRSLEFADFLSAEFDKQYINEDILIETWYLNEIAPHLSKDLHDEVLNLIRDLKKAYLTEDLEEKFNIYTDIGENISEKLLDFIYGEDPPEPVLNAQLKYYLEYLEYLLKDCGQETSCGFEQDIQKLLARVKLAKDSNDKAEKDRVIELFDDLTTKFGRYLDENFVDFKMFKFGE